MHLVMKREVRVAGSPVGVGMDEGVLRVVAEVPRLDLVFLTPFPALLRKCVCLCFDRFELSAKALPQISQQCVFFSSCTAVM